MYIDRAMLGVILVADVLVNLAGNALAFRTAVYLVCPEPSVSLECFDTLRHGMVESDARATLEPLTSVVWRLAREDFKALRPGHHEVQFLEKDLEIVLVIDDGILTEGKAILKGEVVRHHLEPRDPIVDPIRLGMRQLGAPYGEYHPLELLGYLMGGVAGMCLMAMLVAARLCRHRLRSMCVSLPK